MKSGFVSLIGNPNVGKSTIINLLSDRKVSIVTPKAQTTRNLITSILDSDDYQIVLNDTPGVHKANNELGNYMNRRVGEAIKSADVIVLIVSSKETLDEKTLKNFLQSKVDIVVLNKIDLIDILQGQTIKNKLKDLFPKSEILEMCAKDGFNKDLLLNEIIKRLPNGEKFYPDTSILDDMSFDIKEIIREKALFALKEEVPHNIAIEIKDIKKKSEKMYIKANIIVNKDSHKGIVIGKNGNMLKSIGTKSRIELEKKYKKKIFLELIVKVKNDWINSIKDLKTLGY